MGKRFFRILLMVLGIGMLSLVFSSAESQAKDQMVFASWGGTYQDAIRTAWIKPFQQKFGVEVTEDTGPEMAKIKAMVDTNTVTWDIVTGGGFSLVEGMHKGLYEKLPADKVDQSKSYPQARREYGAPSEIFSTLFAFSLKEFPDGKPQPKTWADFWDVKKFPGKRSFYSRRPACCLEIALLADGVPPADVYKVLKTPAGVERGFKKMEELKPHVGVWWTSGAAPVQALGSGEVVMAMGWNGRFQGGIDQGLPIRQVWDGAVAQVGYFMAVKNAPNKETAFKFLNWIVSPEAQAEFYKYVAYGPTTPEAWKYIPKKEWDKLPSSPGNLERSVFLDEAWWNDNEGTMLERWQALLSK
jgi:putative spermidine/putrescine transport system substrate-binding protein